MKRFLSFSAAVLLLLYFHSSALAEGTLVTLSFANLDEWTEKSFKGHTKYSVVRDRGVDVLHAETKGEASGLYRKIRVYSRILPVIRWSWKVAHTLAAEDAHRKSGDDFAARLYIVFPGRFFWQTRALVYVYSDKLPVGYIMPNAYTDRVAVISVESGNQHAGVWRYETRRYVDDYRSYFHADPPDTLAVAVMTDGDNTGSVSEAWYGDIFFSSE